MAGTSHGAPAPSPVSSESASHSGPYRIPAASRTRRNHGVFLLGTELATIYSSRRELDGHGVLLVVGQGALILNGAMTPTQARAVARALLSAADTADASQRRFGKKGGAA